jgi:DNA-3-methyladenine glycosylase II
MPHLVSTAPTFSLTRAIDFLHTFPPCQGELALEPDSIRGAFAIGDVAVPFTVTPGRRHAIAVDTPDPRVVAMVAGFLGVDDQLGRFYDRAAGDTATYRHLVRELRGLHHVRFRTLEEVTVHAVLGQRTPIALASRQKRQVSEALGPRVELAGRTFIAFPAFEHLLGLAVSAWHDLIGNVGKARRLPGVIRGVHRLGAAWLRAAPYAEATSALQAIDGVGPFSAAMILLRGLGRMDDVPLELPGIARVAEAVYGDAWDPDRIRARYGADLGYWSFYLKAGAARLARGRAARAS